MTPRIVVMPAIALVCGLLLSGVVLFATTGLLLAKWACGSAWILSLL
jgi:hypothetical protein